MQQHTVQQRHQLPESAFLDPSPFYPFSSLVLLIFLFFFADNPTAAPTEATCSAVVGESSFGSASYPATLIGSRASGSCPSGWTGKPIAQCQSNGVWKDSPQGDACDRCADSNCLNCTSTQKTGCTGCVAGYGVFEGQCVAVTPTSLNYVPFVVMAGYVLLVGVIYMILRSKSDPEKSKPFTFVNFAFSIFDLAVDINVLVAYASLPLPGVLAVSAALLGISMVVNVVLLMVLIRKDAAISAWMTENYSFGSALLIVSSKSLGAFNIAGSRILNLRLLGAPISTHFSDRLTLFGVSQTLLEDLPQIAIQIYTVVVLQTWSTSVLSLISGIFNIVFKVLVRVILLVLKKTPVKDESFVDMSSQSIINM